MLDPEYWFLTCPLSRVGTNDPWDPNCLKSIGMRKLSMRKQKTANITRIKNEN